MKGVFLGSHPLKTHMKKLFVSILASFLIFSMTSCAGIRNVSDFIENTVPNAIANQTKESILPDKKTSEDSQSNNANPNATQNDSNKQPNDPPVSSLPTNTDSEYLAKLINEITTDTLKACVNIMTAEFKTSNSTIPLRSSIGSGVIFKSYMKNADIYHYYVLTNYHVAELTDTYPYYQYTITDYQGNEYKALAPSWLNDTNLKKLCDENDLSVLEFETTNELKVLPFETKNPNINETLISIGQPKGQKNAITIGTLKGYTQVALQNDFEPSFKVIAHTAPIDHGNSGGAIINTDLKLAGINFAGSWNDDGTFAYGYGIPIETVRKFLSDFGISL